MADFRIAVLTKCIEWEVTPEILVVSEGNPGEPAGITIRKLLTNLADFSIVVFTKCMNGKSHQRYWLFLKEILVNQLASPFGSF